ncbi:MAG: peptide chain release factor 1 [Oscillospiraceae bacterium]|nr:peptide chain release factor 1 [Oscillospiraceae bacterium]
MLEKLRLVENRYLELEDMSGRPDFYNDPKQAASLLREQRSLEPIVSAYRRYLAAKQTAAEMLEMLSGPLEPDMKALCQEELDEAKAQMPVLEQELKLLLLPKDPNDEKNVILEIRAGVGGEESALFAHSLFRMYSMYAEKQGWNIEVTTLNETELGGIKEIVCLVTGQGAYSRLKFETGVHRVQRVPETESGGRVHTSTATVAMLPEVDEVSVELNPADIKMEVFRSSGAGGQHVNKTSSAVRLIHIPTGTVVECQQERSQVQNREKAMRILYSRLYQAQQEAQAASLSAEKRAQVGMGMRNEKIRTYNFPQSRVTDHRIGLTLYKIGEIMDGNLDEIIDALVTADQAEKLQRSQESDDL